MNDSERETRQMLDATESKEAEVIEDFEGPDSVVIIGDVKLKKKHLLP